MIKYCGIEFDNYDDFIRFYKEMMPTVNVPSCSVGIDRDRNVVTKTSADGWTDVGEGIEKKSVGAEFFTDNDGL